MVGKNRKIMRVEDSDRNRIGYFDITILTQKEIDVLIDALVFVKGLPRDNVKILNGEVVEDNLISMSLTNEDVKKFMED